MESKMKRNALTILKLWKETTERKPFYLTGIKGVGKTYLAFEFAKGFFDSYLYLSLEQNAALAEYFDGLSEENTLLALTKYFEVPEQLLVSSLLIIDEVYRCPNLLRRMIKLSKKHPSLFLLLLSSYDILEAEEKQHIEEFVLYPLQFDEFLMAVGSEWYVEVIAAHYKTKRKIPDIVHQELLSTFDEYLWIGGMPDVVNEYLTMEASINVTERQELARIVLLHGMETTAEESISLKCRQVFSTIGEQLKKSNQKFQFNLIRKGITYQMYREALFFLERHHMAYRINELEKEQQFKLFYPDFSLNPTIRNDELTAVERQIRLQNYMFQTFCQKNIPCSFWEAKSQANIEFVLENGNEYTPVELKAEGKNKFKSIHSFQQTFRQKEKENQDRKLIKKVAKFSDSNFVENDDFFNLPVYSTFCFENRD